MKWGGGGAFQGGWGAFSQVGQAPVKKTADILNHLNGVRRQNYGDLKKKCFSATVPFSTNNSILISCSKWSLMSDLVTLF